MTLSLCMIVRDEEKTLARCLDSVKACVDEIIILDTGSTDNTCLIAQKYTDQIYHFSWCDDFSKARNASFSYATCDYIMWLDADDVLSEESAVKLSHLIKNIAGGIDGYMLPYATAYDEDDKPTFTYYRERIVKRNIPHKWVGRVHETLSLDGRYVPTDILVYHRSIKEKYSDRNLLIYERQLSEEGFLTPRDQFYYGRELYYHGKYHPAIRILDAYIKSGFGWIENRIEAYRFMARSYERIDDIENALNALFISLREALPRAETCCEIGRLFLQQKEYQKAIFWFQLAMQDDEEEPYGAFKNDDYKQYVPCLQLCVCYDALGDKKTAFEFNELAARVRPNSTAVAYNRKYFQRLSHAFS